MFAFSFTPKSDAEIFEIQNRGLLPDGTYSFTVSDISHEISKSGNAMLKVKLHVLDDKGDIRNITDYLLATDQMIYKLKHFCESIALLEEYDRGNLNIDHAIARSGRLKIGTQKGASFPDGSGYYADKNTVKDYIKSTSPEIDQIKPIDKTIPLNDPIPF